LYFALIEVLFIPSVIDDLFAGGRPAYSVKPPRERLSFFNYIQQLGLKH